MSIIKLPISCLFILCFLLLSSVSDSFARLRINGGSYSLGYETFEKTQSGTLTNKSSSLSQKLKISSGDAGLFQGMRSSPYMLYLDYTYERYSTDIDEKSYTPSSNSFTFGADSRIVLNRANKLEIHMIGGKGEVANYSLGSNSTMIPLNFAVSEKKNYNTEYGLAIKVGDSKNLLSNFSHYVSNSGYSYDIHEKRLSSVSFQRGINLVHMNYLEDAYPFRNKKREYRSIRIGNVGSSSRNTSVKKSIQQGQRLWFRLTNWLELSTDLAYVKSDENSINNNSKALSLFGRGYRKEWSIFLSPRHTNSSANSIVSRTTEIPIQVNYFPKHSFRLDSTTNLTSRDSKYESGTTSSESKQYSQSFKARLLPNHWLTLRPEYGVSTFRTPGARSLSQTFIFDSEAIMGKTRTSIISQYKNSTSKTAIGGEYSSDVFSIVGKFIYNPASRIKRIGISQSYYLSSDSAGKKKDSITSKMDFASQLTRKLDFDVNYVFGTTTSNSSDGKTTSSKLSSSLKYDSRERLKNNLNVESDENKALGTVKKSLTLENETTYNLGRGFKSSTGILSSKNTTDGAGTRSLAFSEALNYSGYSGGFISRKLYDLGLLYTLNRTDNGKESVEINAYDLSVDYYLSRILSFGAIYSYKDSDATGRNDTRFMCHASMAYARLRAKITYETATTEGDLIKEELEEKISFSLTKIF